MSFGPMRKSALFASTFCLVSILLSVRAYSLFVEQEAGRRSGWSVKTGVGHYGLYSQKRCFGAIHFSASTTNPPLWLLGGKLRLQYEDIQIPLDISGIVRFNSLQQIGGSILTIDGQQLKIVVGSTGVNPIQIEFSLKSSQGEKHFDYNLPGPISLVKTSTDQFAIRHPSVELSHVPLEAVMHQPVIESLGVSIHELEAGEFQECLEEKINSLNLTTQVKFLFRGVGQAKFFVDSLM